jgi:hypothetical protein
MLEQGTDVVCHSLEAQRAVYVGCAPVGLQIGGDDLPAFCEQRQDLAEHLDRADAPCSRISGWPVPWIS